MASETYHDEKSVAGLATLREVGALVAQIAVSHATELARSGRYADAESALALAERTPPALDLLARICAQQGRLVEAQALWSEATRLEPNNESFRTALQRVARMNRGSSWVRAGRFLAAVAIAVLLVILLLNWQKNWWRRERSELVTELRLQVPLSQPAKTPPIRLTVPGTTLRNEDGVAVLRFNSGLFMHGDRLTPQGRSVLMDVAEQLKLIGGRIAVCVVGYGDNLPVSRSSRFRDNRALALARADAAARVISYKANLTTGELSVWSGEGSIYPNDSPENRARNRTVEVRISQISE